MTASWNDLDDDLDGGGNAPDDPWDAADALPQTRQAFAAQFDRAVQGYRHKLSDYSQVSILCWIRPRRGACPSAITGTAGLPPDGQPRGLAQRLWLGIALPQMADPGKRENAGGPPCLYRCASPGGHRAGAYGAKVDEKLKQQTIERLLPCITEGRQFPKDLMLAAVRRAANGIALEPWEAAKTRSIACALVKGYHHRNMEEEHPMALEESCNDRSYLFGRILACAEQAEQNANYLSGEHSGRPTNALRYEVAYTQHPARTLALLRKQLEPYLERLLKAGKSTYANDLMLRLIARIPAEQFNDQPLTELYLLGYACQRAEFFKAKEAKDATPTADK